MESLHKIFFAMLPTHIQRNMLKGGILLFPIVYTVLYMYHPTFRDKDFIVQIMLTLSIPAAYTMVISFFIFIGRIGNRKEDASIVYIIYMPAYGSFLIPFTLTPFVALTFRDVMFTIYICNVLLYLFLMLKIEGSRTEDKPVNDNLEGNEITQQDSNNKSDD